MFENPNLAQEAGEENLIEKEKLVEEVNQQYNEIYSKKRMTLSDEMFAVSHGINPETDEIFETIDGNIGINFDAHGIAKTNQLSTLIDLLNKGIDKNRDFYTAPFEVPKELRAALGAGLGTGGGTAYKDGLAVLTSGYKEKLKENGIKHVFINDAFAGLKDSLAKAYPQYLFHLLSEQKTVMEVEASKAENK